MMVDSNRDGVLTISELQAAVTRVLNNVSDDVVRGLFDEMDMDGDGVINYNEFLASAANKESLLCDENLL